MFSFSGSDSDIDRDKDGNSQRNPLFPTFCCGSLFVSRS